MPPEDPFIFKGLANFPVLRGNRVSLARIREAFDPEQGGRTPDQGDRPDALDGPDGLPTMPEERTWVTVRCSRTA
jgi:hypothetical protein